LALEEGVLAGMSSGGALSAAMKVSSEIDAGVIVFIVCDRGDRYLSSDLYL
jgi:cysteine synthase B